MCRTNLPPLFSSNNHTNPHPSKNIIIKIKIKNKKIIKIKIKNKKIKKIKIKK
jgi:hypothetical protein